MAVLGAISSTSWARLAGQVVSVAQLPLGTENAHERLVAFPDDVLHARTS